MKLVGERILTVTHPLYRFKARKFAHINLENDLALANFIVDRENLCDNVEILLAVNPVKEVELHHDHLLLDVVVALELIIDDVGVNRLCFVADRITDLNLTQEIK